MLPVFHTGVNMTGHRGMMVTFYKWFEAAVTVYAITSDKEIEKLMDELIPIIAKCSNARMDISILR